jgi:hypothetical protein
MRFFFLPVSGDGAAAAIQDLGRSSMGRIGDQRFDEPAEAAEPEVVALGARGGLE